MKRTIPFGNSDFVSSLRTGILLRTAQNVRVFTLPTPHPGQYCSLGNIKDQVIIRHCSKGGGGVGGAEEL